MCIRDSSNPENYIHSKYFDKSSEYYETNLTDTERRIAYNYEMQMCRTGKDVYKRQDGTDLLALFKEKSKNGAGYELYSKRWLQYAKNGWKKENDLVLKIGFDSSGLYDIGQEKGYGAAQNMWMKGVSQSMFEARV